MSKHTGIAPQPPRQGTVGCGPVFSYEEQRGKPTKPKGNVHYAGQICRILQKMNPSARREAIGTKLNENQRLALETYMLKQKKSQQGSMAKARKVPALCDTTPAKVKNDGSVQKKMGGIFKSACAGTVYTYYAKATLRNLTFVARTQRNLDDAIQDHILLTRLLERIQVNSPEKDFPAAVGTAVEEVLEKEGISQQEFLRHCTVTFAAHQWIGRHLSVHCAQLQGALKVWKLLHESKDTQPFVAGPQCITDIAKRAEERFGQMREIFTSLQIAHGKLHQSQLGNLLQELEACHRPALKKMTARWMRQHERMQQKAGAASRIDPQVVLMKQFEHVHRKWDRAIAQEEQRVRNEKANIAAKRRWDGKESLIDFKRRVQRQP